MSNNTRLTPGQIVYVNAKNCKLQKEPKIDSAALAVLQPNTQVVWLAQATKEFHQVKYGNLTGYIFYVNLTKEYDKHYSLKGLKCEVCKGSGYLPAAGVDEAQWGNNFIHPPCPKCGGDGKGVATKLGTPFATTGATKG